jgi:Fe-S-cluster-containing hydrogenase component 2
MRNYIDVNPKLCNGCRICMMVCSLEKSGKFNQFNTGIWIESDDFKGINNPFICRQCKRPVCVEVCPAEKAWKKPYDFDPPICRDEKSGIVFLDTRKESCIGCNECMLSCPFGSIRVNFEDENLVKCDLCGGDPECVKFCPTRAIEFVEMRKLNQKKIMVKEG